MKTSNLQKKQRQPINVSPLDLIKVEYLSSNYSLPLVIKPTVEGLNLRQWSQHNRVWLETELLKHGGILFRGFKVNSIAEFEQFLQAISGELLDYSYRSTPRHQISGKIYTSTEYPAEQFIPLHNEMSYTRTWPLKIAFYCLKKAEQGGETPLADSRKVLQRIESKIREKFCQKGVMYVRNYGQGLDLTWQTVFNTEQKSAVENYCRQANIEWQWKERNRLTTRQICQAIATHHKTAEKVWFNQAHLFHISSLESTIREQFLAEFKDDNLPRNAYYGDRSLIEDAVLEGIRQAYQQEMVIFPWQEGDILLLDNMLIAHGRMPFTGLRKVVVGMAESFTYQD